MSRVEWVDERQRRGKEKIQREIYIQCARFRVLWGGRRDREGPPHTIRTDYFCILVRGNDAISLSKEFSGKNGSKLTQRYPTNAHTDV